MADVILLRFGKIKSAAHRRALLQQLRDAARAAVPQDQPRYRVGTLKHNRFKVELPGGEGTVDAEGAMFDLDEPDFSTISLVFALAKTGGMVMIEGGPSTVLFDRAQSKTLPLEFRRPKPVVCTSVAHLARTFGLSTKQPARAEPKLGKKHQWSHDHDNRYLGRLPGLTEQRNVKHLFIETRPGEGLEHLLKDFPRFVRALKKQGNSVPEGGGLSSMAVHKELRLPGGEIFIPLDVTGYSSRANTDHLVQPNIEAWLAIARAFCRKTKRKTGIIVKCKTFVLDGGQRYPLSRLKSRTAPDDEAIHLGRARSIK